MSPATTDPRRRRSGSQLGRVRRERGRPRYFAGFSPTTDAAGIHASTFDGGRRHHLRGEPRCHAGAANRTAIEVDGDQCRDNEQPEPRPQKPA